MRACILAIICLLATTPPLFAETITSSKSEVVEGWRVVDGDSIDMPYHRFRLAGIDAPEWNQICKNALGENWACGEAATKRLTELLVDRVSCEVQFTDEFRRLNAICTSNGLDVARALVGDGLAIADGKRYKADEAQAKQQKRGIWRGEFMPPEKWRKLNNDNPTN